MVWLFGTHLERRCSPFQRRARNTINGYQLRGWDVCAGERVSPTNRLTLGDCSSRDSRQQKEEERERESLNTEGKALRMENVHQRHRKGRTSAGGRVVSPVTSHVASTPPVSRIPAPVCPVPASAVPMPLLTSCLHSFITLHSQPLFLRCFLGDLEEGQTKQV